MNRDGGLRAGGSLEADTEGLNGVKGGHLRHSRRPDSAHAAPLSGRDGTSEARSIEAATTTALLHYCTALLPIVQLRSLICLDSDLL